jgi:hypothetical protein
MTLLLESGDDLLLEDGSGVLLLEGFPDVHATTESVEDSATTSHDVDMTGVAAGDRAFLLVVIDAAPTLSNFPTGWNQLIRTTHANFTTELWEKLDCTGSESSFQFTSSASECSVNRLFLISGSHATQAAEVTAASIAANDLPDPPSETASWGAEDNLFIALYGCEARRGLASGYPTNYSSNQYAGQNSTGSEGDTVSYGIATRGLAAATDNPGTFTKTGGDRHAAHTVVIRPAAPAISQAIGLASETDLAQAITWKKTEQVAQASETDTARAITARKLYAIATAAETDLAQAVTFRFGVRVAIGQSLETDLAQAVTATFTTVIGQSAETDLAQALGTAKVEQIGLASETDLARALSALLTYAIGLASETDTAHQIFAKLVTDWGPPIMVTTLAGIEQVVETDTAQPVIVTVAIGQATEIDTATLVRLREAIDQATETDEAQAVASATTGALIIIKRLPAIFKRYPSVPRLSLVPLGNGQPSGFKKTETWENASSVFVMEQGTHDEVMALMSAVWAAHSGSSQATLVAAADQRLQNAGYRAPGGVDLT